MKKRPLKDFDKFDFSDVCSSTECTGLITVPPVDEEEFENYMDIYDFGPSENRQSSQFGIHKKRQTASEFCGLSFHENPNS